MQSFGSVFWVLLDSKHSTLKHNGYISLKQIFMYLCIQKTTQENHIYTTFQKWMFYLWEIEAFQIIQKFFQVEPYVFMAKCNCWIIVSNPVCQTTKHQNLVSDLKLTKTYIVFDLTTAEISQCPSMPGYYWISDSNGTAPIKNRCHLSPDVLF